MKKYFLKDATLNNVDDDQFRYQDFSNNLRKIIECNKSPFNIAIVGKWGLGKTSLINMALAPLRNRKKDYLICNINAWKYEKDQIGKAFLKELYENIKAEKILSFNFFHEDYDTLVKKSLNKGKNTEKKLNWKRFGIYLLLCLVLSLIIFAAYCGVSNSFYGINFSVSDFIKSTFIRYCKNIGSILIIPLIVWLGKLFMDKLSAPANNNYEITFPLETQADYEIYLRNILDTFREKNPDKTIVAVVDDLDRLSAEKIVEALDALKVFMEYEELVFIVPFDDEILKNALDNNKLKAINDFDNRYDGDMVLDKLFQYKIYLPQLIKSDMRNYALNICKQDCDDFKKEYFGKNQDWFEEIVGKILIHNNVSTPRQVKKIINTFIENVMVARDRESAKRVSDGFASEKKGLETIAKISVLQADYNEFYDTLFKNVNAINEILMCHRNETNDLMPIDLNKYFIKNENMYQIKREYEPLINFLSFTENLGHTNISHYLYMAQSQAGVVVGDQRQQDFMAAIESCNFVTAKQFLQETPVLLDILMEQLKYDETPLMGNMVVSSVECWEICESEKQIQLAKIINDRINSIVSGKMNFRYDLLNVESIVKLCKAIDSIQYNNLISYSLEISEENQNNEKLIRAISKIKEDVSEDVKRKYEHSVNNWILSDETGIYNIMQFVDEEELDYIANMCGDAYLQRFTDHITGNDDFENDIIVQYGSVLKEFLKNNSITKIERLIQPCFDYPIMHDLLDDAIKDNDYIEMSDSKTIADKIVSIGCDKLHEIGSFNILKKLSFAIDNGDSEKYDNFFLSTVEKECFADLMLGFSKNNSLSLLPKTIKKFTESMFLDEGYSEDARVLVSKFSSEQKDNFWSKLQSECAYSNGKDYNVLGDLFTELEKETIYHDDLDNIINNTILINMKSYYNVDSYRRFTSRIINEFKDYMSESIISEYSLLVLKSITSDTNDVLNEYRNIHMKVSEDIWCKNIDTILKYVSKQTYPIIYDIAASRGQLFCEANSNLSQYLEFLTDTIQLSDKPDEVISAISNKYKSISNCSNLIEKIMPLNIDEENAASKLSKFVNELDINEIIKIVDNNQENREKVLIILSKTQKYSVPNILAQVNEFIDQINKLDILMILRFYETSIDSKNISDFVEILEYLNDKYFEKDVCNEILQQISILPVSLVESQKEIVCKIITTIFSNTSSDELKKKTAVIIKDKKLSQKIRGMFTKEQILEYKSYIS